MESPDRLNNNDNDIGRPPISGYDNVHNNNTNDHVSDDDDYSNAGPAIATPEGGVDGNNNNVSYEDDLEAAIEAAEVSVMDRSGAMGGGATNRNGRGRDIAGDEALIGAAASDEGAAIGAFEMIDESAELVKQRFIQFLSEYCEEINSGDENDNNEGQPIKIYPYAEQATQMAKRQLKRRAAGFEDDDDDDDNNNGTNRQRAGRGSLFANTLFLDFTHVMTRDIELAEAIQEDFVRFEPYLRQAIQIFVLDLHPELDDPTSSNSSHNTPYNQSYFIAVHNLPAVLTLRKLRTDKIGRLSCVSGTVTRTSEVRPELLVGTFRCNKCALLANSIQQQYHYTRPTLCKNPRCQNKSPKEFTLEIQQSQFVDWQKLRVQENSDEIPPGSMPRSIDVIVRNEMVERAKAGDKCIFSGSHVVIPDGSALARAGEAPRATQGGRGSGRPSDAATGGGGGVSGLAALGVKELTYRTAFVASSVIPADALLFAKRAGGGEEHNSHAIASLLYGNQALETHDPTIEEVAMEFTASERDEIQRMKSSPRLYEQLVESIAPATFGHKEVKKGILLMLLGGVHKTTADNIKLRGDINVCIVGDPSTAKSQFLKYVHSFLPSRSVYTSGKASSAAGLTAAVQRDQDTGEYCIEAGALMLADNGYCMIDEFDKMDPSDQVAIHEAMEQQTISITKAGIQATLNARASILAAANPIYGRYDRSKTLKANVALSAPILSRFDLFFVVLDDCNPRADEQVARHILRVHQCCDDDDDDNEAGKPPFTKEQMQRYIRLARTINPKITPASQRVLVDCYLKLRQGDTLGRSRSAYRITVRQLESLTRLSEALARLYCDDQIQPSYVREAYRLLKTSIIRVETSDVEMDDNDNDDDDGFDDHNDDNNDGGGGGGGSQQQQPDGNNNNNTEEGDDSQEDHRYDPETQAFNASNNSSHHHLGEYTGANEESQPATDGATTAAAAASLPPSRSNTDDSQQTQTQKQKQKRSNTKKKKTKISFEEYESITNAIATHLRALEDEDDEMEAEDKKPPSAEKKKKKKKYLAWSETVEWYLEQCEHEIGDSIEALESMRKKLNLIIDRLLYTDNVLVTVGGSGLPDKHDKKGKQQTILALHPNYVIS